MKPLTPEMVREKVTAVASLASETVGMGDAHAAEDELYLEVLEAIAEGRCSDPQGCCQVALGTQDLDFPRWVQ